MKCILYVVSKIVYVCSVRSTFPFIHASIKLTPNNKPILKRFIFPQFIVLIKMNFNIFKLNWCVVFRTVKTVFAIIRTVVCYAYKMSPNPIKVLDHPFRLTTICTIGPCSRFQNTLRHQANCVISCEAMLTCIW